MAISSPGVTLAVPAMFGAIRPVVDFLRRLGTTDFSAEAPEVQVAPGATIKVPVSSIDAASAYNASTNNYLTGGTTTWQSLTATHYLQGFDISGVDVDSGINKGRIEQLFSYRAAAGIGAAIQGAVASALDGTTTSTGVTIPAAASATLADYMGLAGSKSWLNPADTVIAASGADFAKIKSLLVGAGIGVSDEEAGRILGFRDLILVPQMTDRLCLVPMGSLGFLSRVPTIVANYKEFGAETDEASGFSVGIVVADDQATNREIINADVWFGATVLSANAAASTKGIINVGTAA